MRQYAQKTTGATFQIIDYRAKKYGPHGDYSINVVYTDGVSFIRFNGWVNTMGEAINLVAKRAEQFGVRLVGKRERVA